MKSYLCLILLLMLKVSVNSQNLIGYKSSEIKVYMKEYNKDMTLENIVNHRFKYLKYSDNSDSQTQLFFLDSDSVCKSIRITCDRIVRNEKVKELNSSYIKFGDNKWIDTLGRRRCIIELKDDKWSSNFTIDSE